MTPVGCHQRSDGLLRPSGGGACPAPASTGSTLLVINEDDDS